MKSLITEFLAFLLSKLDERYKEFDARLEEMERRQLRISDTGDIEKRLEELERKVFWERYLK